MTEHTKRTEIGLEPRIKTIRQEILDFLKEEECSAAELSKVIKKSEKEIYDHLEHLHRAENITIIPARCAACDFEFEQRRRVSKPGKCPQCKSTRIEPPLFSAR